MKPSRSCSHLLPPFSMPLSLLWLFLVYVPLVAAVRIFDLPPPRMVYRTEPEFEPIKVGIKYYTNDTSLIQPGFVFIAPHYGPHGWGPHIIDQNGDLVWYGQNVVGRQEDGKPKMVMNFGVCDFPGESRKHLCWTEAEKAASTKTIPSYAVNRIFDDQYLQAGPDYDIISGFIHPNPHEFNMFPGGKTFAHSIFRPIHMDLRPYGGIEHGWVLDGCFQEVDVQTSQEVFRWCMLDELPIWHTEIFMHIPANSLAQGNMSAPFAGTGTRSDPWDFMHINAIDKNEEGDYLISGRYLSQILKIAGPQNVHGARPGSILWKLGGTSSDFRVSTDAKFSMQQHCRFVSTGPRESVISLFDNAFNGYNQPTALSSSAKILTIANDSQIAGLTNIYKHPNEYLVSGQGNTQILENGNVYVGWGTFPEWSEFTRDGRLLSHGKAIATPPPRSNLTVANYRAFKFHWVGKPNTNPTLLAYSQTCNMNSRKGNGSPLYAYVSWNGATEVESWRFQVSSISVEGPWVDAGTFPKLGFETRALLHPGVFNSFSGVRYVSVQALDVNHHILATSYNETFVPKAEIRSKCTAFGCNDPKRFHYTRALNRASMCGVTMTSSVPSLVILLLIMLAVEIFDYYIMQRGISSMVELSRLGRSPRGAGDGFNLHSGRRRQQRRLSAKAEGATPTAGARTRKQP